MKRFFESIPTRVVGFVMLVAGATGGMLLAGQARAHTLVTFSMTAATLLGLVLALSPQKPTSPTIEKESIA